MFSKPGQHRSVSDWLRNNQQLSATAQNERLASAAIRQEGRSLRNETNCRVRSSSLVHVNATAVVEQGSSIFVLSLPSADSLG